MLLAPNDYEQINCVKRMEIGLGHRAGVRGKRAL